MKLYVAPGACSMAPHIVMIELGLSHTIEKVDLKAQPHVLAGTATQLTTVNPKGSVPALKLDNGDVLTENAAILQYLADQKPDSGLIPKAGTMERYRAVEWLSYISADVHKAFSPLFNPTLTEEGRAPLKANLDRRLKYLDQHLSDKSFLMGKNFIVADAYLFVVLSWMPRLKLDMTPYPNIVKFHERVGARPSVGQMLKAEGLV